MFLLLPQRFMAAAIFAALLFTAGCRQNPAASQDDMNSLPLIPFMDGANGIGNDAQSPAPDGIDYSDRSNWGKFTEENALTKDVDMFILPGMSNYSGGDYAPIDNSGMRQAVNSFIGSNSLPGRIAAQHVNIYAPYYREASAFSGRVGFYSGESKASVIAAFEYYYNTINKGKRPFILLGFSQGGAVLWHFTCDYLAKPENADIAKNHIITYAIGAPGRPASIPRNSPTQLKFSTSPNDIHVLVHWNSYIETDTLCSSLMMAAKGGPITNPVTWTTDTLWHRPSENPKMGSSNSFTEVRSSNKYGVLFVRKSGTPADTCSKSMMGMHGEDIQYYNASIIANVGDRIAAWKAAYPGGSTGILEFDRARR